MAKKNGMIIAGGTGGHVYPALATAKYFRKRGIKLLCGGRPDSFEKKIFEASGFKFISFRSYKFPRSFNPIEAVYFLFSNILGFCSVFAYFLSFKVEFVLCFGGYISVPSAFAAFFAGVPVYVHEQNSYPGLANRVVSLIAKKVFLTFQESEEYFFKENSVYSGNPLRFTSRGRALEFKCPLKIFVMGGSLGAKILNDSIISLVKEYGQDLEGRYFFHLVSGHRYFDEAWRELRKYGSIIKVHDYVENVQEMYQQSHLVICRGGATTVSELMYFRKPSIIVPGDFATGDHQRKNARTIKDCGAGVILSEKDLSSEKLWQIISSLDEKKYLHMISNLVMISEVAAEKKIYQVIIDGIQL